MNSLLSLSKTVPPIPLFLYFVFALISPIYSSYCGQSAIPFSLEIRTDGQPILGCARPACFGWTPNGKKAAGSAQFYRIWGRPDGFVRVADLEREKKGNGNGSLAMDRAEYSICDHQYGRDRCPPGTWVGGIAPDAKIEPRSPLKLLCCSYSKLANSVQSDQVEVRTGDLVQGGEMLEGEDGREISFEYIANLQRLFDRNGVVYVVEVRKFTCFSGQSVAIAPQTSSGMRITATFDGDEQRRKSKEEESEEEGDLEQELRIGAPNGGKEEERKLLAEFSEYEGELLKGTAPQNSLGNDLPSQTTSSSSQKSQLGHQHLHIGQIGPKMRSRGNEGPKQQQESQKGINSLQNGHKDLENHQVPAKFDQRLNRHQHLQIPINQQINANNGLQQIESQRKYQQQPQPVPLLSPSPFGGYQMHHSPPQIHAAQYSQQQTQISSQQSPQSTQLLMSNPIPLIASPFSHSTDDGAHQRRQPLLKIPSPEEIENAIPPHGKLLLSNLARTFLGLQRLF